MYFIITWSPYFPLRQPTWVLSQQNLGDHQTLSISSHVGFHVAFISLSHPFFDMLINGHFILVTLCKAK